MKDPNWKKCLLRADSKDIIRRIPDHSVDMILTDPPYNLGLYSTGNIPLPGRSAINNDVAEWDKVPFHPEDWADDFIRILKPTGNLFIFTSYNQIGRWYECLDGRFDASNFMIWHKTNPAPKIFKAGFLNSCEMIFTCWNKRHTWNFISQKDMHNFVESPICMRPERLSNPKHPTQKPVAILRKMLEIATNKNDIVFDPFMGVGSTGVAALELGRRFIGVEINEEYFAAASRRIHMTLEQATCNEYRMERDETALTVNEPTLTYLTSVHQIQRFLQPLQTDADTSSCDRYSKLSPIIKWPGGKEKELKYILPNLPKFDRYFEPFVGGGSVFMGIDADEYFINDFSAELMQLYHCIATRNEPFYHYAEAIDMVWRNARTFFMQHKELVQTFLAYRNEDIDDKRLKVQLHAFCQEQRDGITAVLGYEFAAYTSVLQEELASNLVRKMLRMRTLELQKHLLPYEDVCQNVETAIKSAVYMTFRHLYNNKQIRNQNKWMHGALFFFLRNYAYSGMFRYSSKGEFNVPYGGIAYNAKLMEKKLAYYRSHRVLHHFERTHIYNEDFETFMRQVQPTERDFVFLDPPYDSEFSTYAGHAFTSSDQERLANYMIHECKARWMLIIKNTDFIYQLYNYKGIHIQMFDKEYLVSFMNRNDKKVTHLLITNYEIDTIR